MLFYIILKDNSLNNSQFTLTTWFNCHPEDFRSVSSSWVKSISMVTASEGKRQATVALSRHLKHCKMVLCIFMLWLHLLLAR